MKNKHYLLILLLLLPVILFRDYTPNNELRYISIADEALRNGHFFTFTNQGNIYADKPPLYFWVFMIGKWLLGSHQMWFLSLFSLLPALGIVKIMDKWVSAEMSVSNRISSGLILMSCGLFLGAALILRMDMLMSFFIVLSLYIFYRMYKDKSNSKRNAILFSVCIFMAVFTKGAVGIIVPMFATFFFLLVKRKMRTFCRYWGWKTWGILLLLCVVWFGCVYAEAGYDYLSNMLFHQTIERAFDSFHHKEPFYYYFISIWYSLAPWSLLLAGVILTGIFKRVIYSDLEQFFLTIIITTFVMLSCISSKVEIYMLPAFPFFVYLTGLFLPLLKRNKCFSLFIAIPAICFCLIAPVFVLFVRGNDLSWLRQPLFYIVSFLLSLVGIVSLVLLYIMKNPNRAVNILVISLFCALFAGGWALPSINNRLGYADLCQKAMEISKSDSLSGYCVLDMKRPENMDVFLHEDVIKITAEDLFNNHYSNTVLMLPAKRLKNDKILAEFISKKKKYRTGNYWIVSL
ncbi:MAG: dolichyl-phosphate-mannose--protein mannosyltransferase [Prevotellaceae bacterium]|jgi:4-amino-4-deoxy-L-arabinose transferase-like glycosyltransferase|nr:dolichyl-phosphate-mannose--protein mannosyltransferase [Prevotellaceae bacterium]